MPTTLWGPSLGEQPGKSKSGKGAASRLAAVLALTDVLARGRALDQALEQRLAKLQDPRDRGLASEIAYGVLRRRNSLLKIANGLLRQPFKARDLDVECLLLAGLYQLRELRVPAHAAVSETVAASRLLRKDWARGLLNAVLRNYQRNAAGRAVDTPEELDFPNWLTQRLQKAWPEHWRDSLQASNRHPPMVLRVNGARVKREAYALQLAAAGITARPMATAPDALRLDQPTPVENLPGFDDGLVSVQDSAAQLAARLLDPQPGDRVLDACAAPGGKTCHLLELESGIHLTAVDKGEQRLGPLRSNLERLGLNARVLDSDLTRSDGPWNDQPYQRILLDAPCSATGVIRRHPDIKWLRREEDIAKLALTQDRILDNLWLSLAPGGLLLYATCSLLAEENQLRIQAFLQRTADAHEAPLEVDWGRAAPHGRQILVGDADMDGFYYCLLRKSAAETGA